MIRIRQTPTGPRFFLFGIRVHHFAAGLVAIGLGAIACAHDKDDMLIWLLHGRKALK